MKRLECLDGLRGILALYVLVGHMAPFAILPAGVQRAVSHGGAAVDLFFVLSGLVISLSLDRFGRRTRPFLIARATRIFPVFLPVFLLAVAVQTMSCGFEAMPWIAADSPARTICSEVWPRAWVVEIAAHLTMTHGLFPNSLLPDVWVSMLGAAWSLSTEWQFYILALLLAGHSVALSRALVILAAAGLAWQWAGPEAWQFSRAFLPNKAHFFALGVASLPLVRHEAGAMRRYGMALAACLAICAASGAGGKLLPPLVWTACMGVVLWPDVWAFRAVGRVLRCPTAQYLGAISYCVYLVNEPVHKLTASALSVVAGGSAAVFTVLWIPAAILLPVAVSMWLHRWLDTPAILWGRRTARGSLVAAGRALPPA